MRDRDLGAFVLMVLGGLIVGLLAFAFAKNGDVAQPAPPPAPQPEPPKPADPPEPTAE